MTRLITATLIAFVIASCTNAKEPLGWDDFKEIHDLENNQYDIFNAKYKGRPFSGTLPFDGLQEVRNHSDDDQPQEFIKFWWGFIGDVYCDKDAERTPDLVGKDLNGLYLDVEGIVDDYESDLPGKRSVVYLAECKLSMRK